MIKILGNLHTCIYTQASFSSPIICIQCSTKNNIIKDFKKVQYYDAVTYQETELYSIMLHTETFRCQARGSRNHY